MRNPNPSAMRAASHSDRSWSSSVTRSPSASVLRGAARFVQEQESQQADSLRLGKEIDRQSAQAQGVFRQALTGEVVAGGRGVSFVVDEVDHLEDGAETLRDLGARGDLVGNLLRADLLLGARDPLLHCLRSDKERPGNFLGRKTAHFAQREGNPGIPRQGRMTTGEDQAELVILDGFPVPFLGVDGAPLVLQRDPRQQPITAPSTAEGVDALEPTGGYEPGPRIARHPFPWPALEGRTERFLECLLGKVEISEEPDEGSQYPTRLGAVDLGYSFVYRWLDVPSLVETKIRRNRPRRQLCRAGAPALTPVQRSARSSSPRRRRAVERSSPTRWPAPWYRPG